MHLTENARSQIRTQTLRRDQIEIDADVVFQKLAQPVEVGESVSILCELHKNIDVARRGVFFADNRPEEPNPTDAQTIKHLSV